MKYIEIAVDVPIHSLFTYILPDEYQDFVHIGSLVSVPFRKMMKRGVVVRILDTTDVKNPKPILGIEQPNISLSKNILKLLLWMSDYYQCPVGEAVFAAIPKLTKKSEKKSTLTDEFPLLSTIKHQTLTPEQNEVMIQLLKKLNHSHFNVNLIYGVTGSGKTELYLHAIHNILNQGKGILVLVPEITLTYQLINRIKERFGNWVAVLHSGLTGSVRSDEWWRAQRGEARIVVGVRSAVFAPVKNLGLIIIDEEHENTFKQDNNPRYHARDVAIMRAKIESASIILGSATPSMESYYNALLKRYTLYDLSIRIDNRPMPKYKVIDMRKEINKGTSTSTIISPSLNSMMRDKLINDEQVLLFLNRRGYSTVLMCRACGKAYQCNHCSVPMTYHKSTHRLLCHYCGLVSIPPDSCENCGSGMIKYLGTGTQQVEECVQKLFPEYLLNRLDVDVSKKRGVTQKILKSFIQGETKILLGTQMIAKGIDISTVTLVGVINADQLLNLIDYRSAERAYALLTQVAGRAGRGTSPGLVAIQTFNPNHHALCAVINGERHEFYRRELRLRHKLGFPPYQRLALSVYHHRKEETCFSQAAEFARTVRQLILEEPDTPIEVLGPSFATIQKIKDKYRCHVLMKMPKAFNHVEFIKKIRTTMTEKGVVMPNYIDIDPVSLLQ